MGKPTGRHPFPITLFPKRIQKGSSFHNFHSTLCSIFDKLSKSQKWSNMTKCSSKLGQGQLGFYIFVCYLVAIPLSDYEAFVFLQRNSLLLHFRIHYVSNPSTPKFLLDAFHTLFEMIFFHCLCSTNHYKKTLLGEEFNPIGYDIQ
jgi:hypothetical protein